MAQDMSYSEARKHLTKLWDRAVRDREAIRLTRRGSEPVVLVAADEYEGLVETAQQKLTLERLGQWWIVWSKRDWLEGEDRGSAFRSIVHNPHGGPNNMRLEVLLTAFASDVITMSEGRVEVVKGSPDRELEASLEPLRKAGRVVAFRG